jgi:hypothetical protein
VELKSILTQHFGQHEEFLVTWHDKLTEYCGISFKHLPDASIRVHMGPHILKVLSKEGMDALPDALSPALAVFLMHLQTVPHTTPHPISPLKVDLSTSLQSVPILNFQSIISALSTFILPNLTEQNKSNSYDISKAILMLDPFSQPTPINIPMAPNFQQMQIAPSLLNLTAKADLAYFIILATRTQPSLPTLPLNPASS